MLTFKQTGWYLKDRAWFTETEQKDSYEIKIIFA